MNTFQKSDLIKNVADAADITRAQAEKAINSVFDQTSALLLEGHKVSFHGFGSFTPKIRKPRKVVLRGEETTTRQMQTVGFTPFSGLKQYT